MPLLSFPLPDPSEYQAEYRPAYRIPDETAAVLPDNFEKGEQNLLTPAIYPQTLKQDKRSAELPKKIGIIAGSGVLLYYGLSPTLQALVTSLVAQPQELRKMLRPNFKIELFTRFIPSLVAATLFGFFAYAATKYLTQSPNEHLFGNSLKSNKTNI